MIRALSGAAFSLTEYCRNVTNMNSPKSPVPRPTAGLRHVALNVSDVEACERFYVGLLGMKVEWRPDADNVYLTSGNDNLAIHRSPARSDGRQSLDHIGFILNDITDVDAWCEFLRSNAVPIAKEPKTHRDGARSFYCVDPEGVIVQMIYHPPLVKQQAKG
jgi:catechol 2,3-dioxygenase-like lactoylglutathione lyase family enzyme